MVAVGTVTVVALPVHHGLVPSRVERIADLAERDQAELGEHRVELVGDRLERAGQIAVRPRPVDVVQHRQQVGDYPTGGELADHDPVAVDPLAVVGVLGLQALQVGGALRELGLARSADARQRRAPRTSARSAAGSGSGWRASPVIGSILPLVADHHPIRLVRAWNDRSLLVTLGALVHDLGVDDGVVGGLARPAS